MAVRQGQSSYTPPKSIAQMEADLSSIVMFLGSDGDCVIGKQPDNKLTDFWSPMIGHRKFITDNEAISRISLGEWFAPWGYSRATFTKYGLSNNLFKQDYRTLLSRRTSVLVEHLISRLSQDRYPSCSTLIDREDDIKKHIEGLLRNGDRDVVIKNLWSASGRGVRFFNLDMGPDDAIEYAKRCLKADRGVVIEKKLERVAEFSYILFYKDGAIKYEGINTYHSANSGGMGWEIAGRQPFLPDMEKYKEEVAYGAKSLMEALTKTLAQTFYEGPIGVDAMLYKRCDDTIGLRPCTEVNMRYCMGHIAQKVKKLFAEGTPIKWQMSHFSSTSALRDFCEEQEKLYPTLLDDSGKITSGFFRLTAIGDTTQFGAFGWSGESGIVKV